jgi:high frequency lysogenization protein
MKERSLALAGLLQAADAVVTMAADGRCDPALLNTAIDSVFRIDADSTVAVYGQAAALRRGLELLAAHAGGQPGSSVTQGRIAYTVLQVERKLNARADLLAKIQEAILRLAPQQRREGSTDPALLAELGELYARTISTLTPRVLVQGDPQQLARHEVVMAIRALLLAAVRSAVLWRQLGGSFWDFFLRRGQIAQAARHWLATIE